MSRYCSDRDIAPILDAAQSWKKKCLLGGDSVFGDESLWNAKNSKELYRLWKTYYESDAPRVQPKDFAETLLSFCDAEDEKELQAKLIAEVYWVLYLCPYKRISVETKKSRIQNAWKLSGGELEESHFYLSEEVLRGAGSAGQRFNRSFWYEFGYFADVLAHLLPMENDERKSLVNDGWKFSEWLEDFSDDDWGNVQFRHMFLFLLFPDEFERVFSASDRKAIATAFNPNLQDVEEMSQCDLDKLLLETRQKQEREKGQPIDWYDEEMEPKWKKGVKVSEGGRDYEDDSDFPGNHLEIIDSDMAKNIIFYGPPGTGKTYSLNQLKTGYVTKKAEASESDRLAAILGPLTWWQVAALVLAEVNKAVEVIEIAKHEWVEIKGKLTPSNENVKPTLWSVLHGRSLEAEKPTHPIIFVRSKNKSGRWEWQLSADWKNDVPEVEELLEQLRKTLNASAARDIFRYEYVTFHQSYGYEDFVEGIRPVQGEGGQEVNYRIEPGVFKQICFRAKQDPDRRYAIFIDEINRGKISKIFGELITLLEPDKRARYSKDGVLESGMELTLPYSKESFGVPENLDVYATMNTADRSIVLMDTALRRRFKFEELMPDVKLIKGDSGGGTIDDDQGGYIDLRKLLEAINKRIQFLRDRDHVIGHSYFMGVKSFEDLQRAFSLEILPLLKEYFYEDWRKIQIVLRDIGGDGQPNEHQIVHGERIRELDAIGFDHDDYEDQVVYSENEISPASIRKIYE